MTKNADGTTRTEAEEIEITAWDMADRYGIDKARRVAADLAGRRHTRKKYWPVLLLLNEIAKDAPTV